MQEELTALQPELIQTSAETDKMMVKIEAETVDVDAKKELVSADEKVANEAAAAAQLIKVGASWGFGLGNITFYIYKSFLFQDDCEGDLAEAMPALEAALAALDTLKPSDITLLKSMQNPPALVKLVLESICIMKGIKPERKQDTKGSGKVTALITYVSTIFISDSLNMLKFPLAPACTCFHTRKPLVGLSPKSILQNFNDIVIYFLQARWLMTTGAPQRKFLET